MRAYPPYLKMEKEETTINIEPTTIFSLKIYFNLLYSIVTKKNKQEKRNKPLIKASHGKIVKYAPKSIAPTDPLKRYIWEVNQYPLLSREEEEHLIKEFKEII